MKTEKEKKQNGFIFVNDLAFFIAGQATKALWEEYSAILFVPNMWAYAAAHIPPHTQGLHKQSG